MINGPSYFDFLVVIDWENESWFSDICANNFKTKNWGNVNQDEVVERIYNNLIKSSDFIGISFMNVEPIKLKKSIQLTICLKNKGLKNGIKTPNFKEYLLGMLGRVFPDSPEEAHFYFQVTNFMVLDKEVIAQ